MLFRIFYDVILKYYRRLIATLVLSAISLPASVVAASLSGVEVGIYRDFFLYSSSLGEDIPYRDMTYYDWGKYNFTSTKNLIGKIKDRKF